MIYHFLFVLKYVLWLLTAPCLFPELFPELFAFQRAGQRMKPIFLSMFSVGFLTWPSALFEPWGPIWINCAGLESFLLCFYYSCFHIIIVWQHERQNLAPDQHLFNEDDLFQPLMFICCFFACTLSPSPRKDFLDHYGLCLNYFKLHYRQYIRNVASAEHSCSS